MEHNLVIGITRECEVARFDLDVPLRYCDLRWGQCRPFDGGESVLKVDDFDSGWCRFCSKCYRKLIVSHGIKPTSGDRHEIDRRTRGCVRRSQNKCTGGS